MSLTKDKIISDIYNNVGLSKGQSRSVVEKLFGICKETLERGRTSRERVRQIRGETKGVRRGRNPRRRQTFS